MAPATYYLVVRNPILVDLESEVNVKIEEGWWPQGGIQSDHFCFYQAMVWGLAYFPYPVYDKSPSQP